ncbi:class I adenylate-forming enzyme family protein [[Mycobacterium] wendilense]|uniref:Class I adenylate-forming enzyme family protein n=1 Tax=[Mycobacterium] wendilense TaxID=3064284 RepID=A0ABM9MKJ5_9MYCO|nr:class I adenylate-forming enzyme family protein [Mycolicibacterium sp. MU0050]CAJ1587484.1 class I adenylate-forming enzyme family protein [Mycolicibacterium sp. MU0050]
MHRHGARPFLVFHSDTGTVTTWTYRQFDAVVTRTAEVLARHGVDAGDPVHLALRNSPPFVAVWLAAARLGAWIVPADPAVTPRDVRAHFERTEPRLGICARSRATPYQEGAVPAAPILELAEDESDIASGGALSATVNSAISSAPRSTDRLAVLFTSGTTSAPKGAMVTQANYVAAAEFMARASKLVAAHRWFVTLPLFHANAQYYCFASAIAVGSSVALTSAFSASRWIEQARALSVTHASLFAAPIRMILDRTSRSTTGLSLQHVWFAQNLAAAHYDRFAKLAGTRPRQLYGMTETIAAVSCDSRSPYRHDVLGEPLPGRRIRLRSPETGQECGIDEVGELMVHGRPGHDLFGGYFQDAAATARVLVDRDGDTAWLATGDLMSRDATGVLRFVGRLDDVIKVAGENVSLAEVEVRLTEAPGVREAAVVARPDPVRDTVPHAFIVPTDPTKPPTSEELNDWAAGNLLPSGRPVEWHLIDELPRTSVGKIRRSQLPQTGSRLANPMTSSDDPGYVPAGVQEPSVGVTSRDTR